MRYMLSTMPGVLYMLNGCNSWDYPRGSYDPLSYHDPNPNLGQLQDTEQSNPNREAILGTFLVCTAGGGS